VRVIVGEPLLAVNTPCRHGTGYTDGVTPEVRGGKEVVILTALCPSHEDGGSKAEPAPKSWPGYRKGAEQCAQPPLRLL